MMENQILIFRLHEEEFGIDIYKVNEIIRTGQYTQMPATEFYVKGIVNFRGKVVPIIDLNLKLGFEEQKDDDDSRIIIVEMNKVERVGFRVDLVLEVMKLSEGEIRPPPPVIIQKVDKAYLKGIVIRDKRLIIVLDAEQILSGDETKSIRKIIPKEKFEVDIDRYSWFNEGRPASDIDELRNLIIDIDEKRWIEHVNEKRNDFSDWLRYVMQDDDTANIIQDLRTKEEILEALDSI